MTGDRNGLSLPPLAAPGAGPVGGQSKRERTRVKWPAARKSQVSGGGEGFPTPLSPPPVAAAKRREREGGRTRAVRGITKNRARRETWGVGPPFRPPRNEEVSDEKKVAEAKVE